MAEVSSTVCLEKCETFVHKFDTFVQETQSKANILIDTFTGGRLANFISEWQRLTSDRNVLEIVTGLTIPFHTTPVQSYLPRQKQFFTEVVHIQSEIDKLLKKKVIRGSQHEQGEFISPIFLRPKKDGSHRMILNLRSLNQFVVTHHFKMDSLHSAIQMMSQSCYMASVDIKDAYYYIKSILHTQSI